MISIYDPYSLDIICNIPKIISVQWTRRFYDAGGFEIHVSTNSPYLSDIKKGYILHYRESSGIIRYIQQTKDDITICGSDLKCLLDQRIIIPPFVYLETPAVIDGYDRISGCVEDIMRHYVDTQAVNPTDANRKLPFLSIAPTGSQGKQAKWQSRFDNLLSTITKIGQYDEIGFDISFDSISKGMLFGCKKGIDRTATTIFSRSYKNIEDFEYTLDDLSTINTTYVGGDGEEEAQYIEKVYETSYTGIDRREDYITESGDNIDDIKDKGLAHLKEKVISETVECDANTKLKYKTDWDLGDYVTVKIDILGETVVTEKQITEVKEIYEHSNIYASPVFGNKKENIIKKILKEGI